MHKCESMHVFEIVDYYLMLIINQTVNTIFYKFIYFEIRPVHTYLSAAECVLEEHSPQSKLFDKKENKGN